MTTIKERVKELRKEKNLTQEELSKLLGLNSKSNIANYENGTNAPSDDIKLRMCKIFNCTMDYLMGKSYYRNYEDFKKIDSLTLNYQRTQEETELLCNTLNYINKHRQENVEDIINEAVKSLPLNRQEDIKKIMFHLHYTYHGKLPEPKQEINIDEADIAFASGIKGLNETNKAIIKSTIEALLAKQEKDEEDKK